MAKLNPDATVDLIISDRLNNIPPIYPETHYIVHYDLTHTIRDNGGYGVYVLNDVFFFVRAVREYEKKLGSVALRDFKHIILSTLPLLFNDAPFDPQSTVDHVACVITRLTEIPSEIVQMQYRLLTNQTDGLTQSETEEINNTLMTLNNPKDFGKIAPIYQQAIERQRRMMQTKEKLENLYRRS